MTEKPTMPKPDTGVHRRARSTSWQWRIKAPLDLRHLYKGEWAHRESLGTADLRIANIKAAALRSDWLSRFAEQRRSLSLQKVDRLTPELGKLIADLMLHRVLAGDERGRTDPATRQSQRSRGLRETISGRGSRRSAQAQRPPMTA
jgi:hypothetical protein